MAANAVVAMLDAHHHERVAWLWREVGARFGLRGIYRTPYPHFSFHVAGGYDFERIRERLQDLAAGIQPFEVRTSGIGVFTAARTVVYVAMVRDPALDSIHRRVWSTIDGLASGGYAYYRPDAWVPHITLVQDQLDAGSLGTVAGWLGEQGLVWEAGVRSLGLIRDRGTHQDLSLCFELGKGRAWSETEREAARVIAACEEMEP